MLYPKDIRIMAAYVKNKDLLEQLRLSKKQDKLTPEALNMLILMANRLTWKLNYKNPEDRKDCISFAIMDCLRYWRNFDETRSQNPFAYFTQVCKNGFAKGWRLLHPVQSSSFIRINENCWQL